MQALLLVWKISETYSRDALASPLRKLAEMIEAIRAGKFMPDNTRSGRFLQDTSDAADFGFSDKSWTRVGDEALSTELGVGLDEACSQPGPIVISDEEDVKPDPSQDLGGSEVAVSSSSSSESEGIGDTSSSSDEQAGAECPGQRMVRVPSTPAGFSLVQQSKLTLHLLENGYQKVLACGRPVSAMHRSTHLTVRWDTPCCHNCWRRVKPR